MKRLMLRWRLAAHRRASTPAEDVLWALVASPFLLGLYWHKIIVPLLILWAAITGEKM